MPDRAARRVFAAGALALACGALAEAGPEVFVQPRSRDERFVNLDGEGPHGFSSVLRWKVWDGWILGKNRKSPDRAPVPRVEPDWEAIATPPGKGEGARLTWIGHATWLVQLDGMSFLTDPVLGDSITGFIGRNVPPAIPIERMPPIDAVLVSHSHYDHMDLPSLRRLGAPVVAGLGMAALLRDEELTGTDLGWWQSTEVGGVRITFVPAQHFSQRGLGDRNQTLWGGFVIQGSSATVYHAGDTAYFQGFRQIGERFAIDAALLPIGAYDPRWFMKAAHVDPEEALQAFVDLKARTFLAMHWGTFKLADEPLDEPPRLLEEGRVRRGLPPERVRAPAIGETVMVRRAPAASTSAAEPEPAEVGASPLEL
jgi:L-ascorbate metabolism protein UlaG (beta-lactamase superfamily)